MQLEDNNIEIRDSLFWPKKDRLMWEHLQKTKDAPYNISRFCKEKNTIIQAGGNAGYYPRAYSEIFENVYTFEPDRINFNCLVLNTLDKVNVFRYEAGLGNERKTFALTNDSANCGAYSMGSMETTIGDIPMLKIDDLNLNKCDLIHLDVEGYEIEVLKGAKNTIEKLKPIICVEIAWSDATQFLNELGYVKMETSKNTGGDYIFVPKI